MTTYTVTGLTCNGCVARTLKVLQTFDSNAQVTLDPPQATLQAPDLNSLNKALQSVGNYVLLDRPTTAASAQTSSPLLTPTSTAFLTPASTPFLTPASTPFLTPVSRATPVTTSWLATYAPLLIIFGFITGVTSLEFLRSPNTNGETWMMDFMAGFFLVFGFFKLLNLRAFALNFKAYDLAAMAIPGYAIAYPFIEVGLGVAYLMRWSPLITNSITIVIMGIGALGVLQALRHKKQIDCACLGTVFKLPMSTVTLVEDLLMLLMAVVMLASIL
jgi:copper chaperone CopZ